jgi:hypothetical protein
MVSYFPDVQTTFILAGYQLVSSGYAMVPALLPPSFSSFSFDAITGYWPILF